ADAVHASHAHVEHTGFGFELQARPPGDLGHQPADAAHAVAARFDFTTVAVVNAHVGFRARILSIAEHHHLVETGGRPSRDGPHLLLLELAGAAAQIDHHDLVAQTVHLFVGETRC